MNDFYQEDEIISARNILDGYYDSVIILVKSSAVREWHMSTAKHNSSQCTQPACAQ